MFGAVFYKSTDYCPYSIIVDGHITVAFALD